jgi:hypothetical protein
MIVKKISFPVPLTDIEDIYDDNIDVFVDLENGHSYTVGLGTPKNLLTLMNNEKSNFLPPGEPMIIVRKLTMEVIQEAIQAYAEHADGYWLKLHHFAFSIGPDGFDKLQKSQDEEDIEFDKELNNL